MVPFSLQSSLWDQAEATLRGTHPSVWLPSLYPFSLLLAGFSQCPHLHKNAHPGLYF